MKTFLLKSSLLILILVLGLRSPGLCQGQASVFSQEWPQFRGLNATGILDGANIPVSWDLETGENVLWKTPIPGLGHSCPVIWGDKIFVTTAISATGNDGLKVGLYGDIDEDPDVSVHQFRVYCLNKHTGEVIWNYLAHEGVPKTKRHTKSSHANPTPATDGKHLVVFFGSEGLFCFDLDGKLLWQKDLGILRAGPYTENGVEWGVASSPVIYQDRVIIQSDVLDQSFIAAFNIETGEQIWRADRDEITSWGSPTVNDDVDPVQVVVNGWKHMGGYTIQTGEEVWKMSNGGDAPSTTPVIYNKHVFINNAHGRYSPIYVVKPTAQGDITLGDEELSNEHIVWSVKRGGAYMATPLIYKGLLYNLQVNGFLTVFDAMTGEEKYKETLGREGFSASGVASDDKIYFSAEGGTIYVIEAGPEFKLLHKNEMNDVCMATPALDGGAIYFRTQHFLVAIGE